MSTITTEEPGKDPKRRRNALAPLTIADVADGVLQEGQDLDFKRLVDLTRSDARVKLVDDVVAFLNRGSAQIITGGYTIRSGARNIQIDPGMLRSRFINELFWLRTLDQLTADEDAALASSGAAEPAAPSASLSFR